MISWGKQSHMKWRTWRRVVAVLLTALCVHAGSAQTSNPCPQCWRNVSVMGGHGAAPGDPRRLINVRIDQSFGNQTPASIWNATCAGSQSPGCSTVSGPSAIQMWNAVPTYYNLRLVQNPQGPDDATDIQITRDSTWDPKNGCAYTQRTGRWIPDPERPGANLFQIRSRIIHLPPGSENWSQQQLACVLGHEFGHALGIDHVFRGCPASIMNQNRSNQGCVSGCPRTQVADVDVQAVNQQAGNRVNCQRDAQPRTRISTGGRLQDPDPYRYNPICYGVYEPIDFWYCRMIMSDGTCHPEFPPQYLGTIYVLREVRCY